jgi:hypothetical protein
MSKEFDKDRLYAVPGDWLIGLKRLEKELYSERRMGGDKMRDWGNWLNQGFFNQVEEVDDRD